jgi:hypothetical protein
MPSPQCFPGFHLSAQRTQDPLSGRIPLQDQAFAVQMFPSRHHEGILSIEPCHAIQDVHPIHDASMPLSACWLSSPPTTEMASAKPSCSHTPFYPAMKPRPHCHRTLWVS